MAKGNQKARFSVVPLFNFMPDASRNIVYLDHQEVIDKIPVVEQALRDIKARKREDIHRIHQFREMAAPSTYNGKYRLCEEFRPHPDKKQKIDYIQRGFDIAERWKNENER